MSEPTTTSSECPECGGTGARGCGAAWHDGKPDAPSPLDEPTAAPTRPTREQATQALLDATEAISAYINAGGADGCLDSANVIGIWSTDGRQARITQGDLRRIAEVRAALLAGEGTAQPEPSKWAERVREATTEVLDQKDLVVGLEAMCDHGSKQWAQLVYNSHERLRRASGEGTAPQPLTNPLGQYEFICEHGHHSTTSRQGYDRCAAEFDGIPCGAEITSAVVPAEAVWGTAPQPDQWAEGVRDATAEVLDVNDLALALTEVRQRGSAQWARSVYDSHEKLRSLADRGAAPQVPAEAVRDEIESLRMTLAELDSEHAASSRVASALAAAIGWETPGELWVDKARHLAPLAAELEAARELRAARNGETTKEHRPAEAVHPGEMLQDELEERGMTQASLAEALGHASPATVSRLCNGRADMNAATALGLERALGTSAELWLRLQMAYDLHHARVRVVAADGAPQEGDER